MIQIDVAVCDDEPFVAKTISEVAQKELSRHGFQARIEIVHDALSLAQELKEQGFDLMLLDIEMPLVDGIEFSRMLRGKGDRTELVFVSNAEDRVFESLPVRPLYFVRKSHFADDMKEAINAFAKSWKDRKQDRMVSFATAHAQGTFSVDDILYIEARRRQKIIHMATGHTAEVTATLEDMADELAPYGFYRVHKGFIVNFAHVEQMSSKGIAIGGDLIPISRGTIQDIRLAYMDFLSKKNAVIL